MADIVVTGAPQGASSGDSYRTVDPGSLVLRAGRPVLVAAQGAADLPARKVVVAWKDTREARRAVIDAMPFLADARQVLVATVIEEDVAEARESAADVVRFLMKHGVKARSETLNAGDTDATEALLAAGVKIGAGLVAIGADGEIVATYNTGGMYRGWVTPDGLVHVGTHADVEVMGQA